MLKALIVFAAVAGMDLAWTAYTAAVTKSRASAAGAWSVVIYLLSACVVLEYTHNRWMLIPAALGAFTGTWLGVRWCKK